MHCSPGGAAWLNQVVNAQEFLRKEQEMLGDSGTNEFGFVAPAADDAFDAAADDPFAPVDNAAAAPVDSDPFAVADYEDSAPAASQQTQDVRL